MKLPGRPIWIKDDTCFTLYRDASMGEDWREGRIMTTDELEVYITCLFVPIYDLVDKQAEDDGLWFEAKTAPEAYLQQELRRLHAVIEELVELGEQ